ncbi:replication factor C subunit 5 [Ascoidea rubescens DSM 1968]|uniref:DNA replication factor C n=1 Tax=Ascoidea rubescens DSM 1968 TaxID=1344418 RepID=A0A1D2VJX7_9ASCO|nr:DNA replication factor C [Ascoidea rubescens DSM 1968]ODV61912.1 DNA replication factor C [Ascoidea rubescens DSM 1968]
MSLWVDRYRPKTLVSLDFHQDVANRLKALASSGDFPHLLIYGPSGGGKKTSILATLNELYGSGIEKMKIDVRTFTTPTNRKLEFNVISSNYHIEITPSDMGNNDRIVIQELLKEIGQTEQIDFQTGKHRFKVVIINDAESLTRDAQAALRRTMEKYSTNIRLILIAESTSNIILPIKSRTLLIRCSLPTIEEINRVLLKISKKENLQENNQLPQNDRECLKILNRISINSERNLRKAILLFESLVMIHNKLTINTPIIELDWELVIKNLSNSVLKNRSVSTLSQSRSILYELISHCIPPIIILKKLAFFLICNERIENDDVKFQIVDAASVFNERLNLGSKAIFHLEGFLAKTMVILEKNRV